MVLAYIAVFVQFSPLPLQDYPNHLARAFVMADLIFHQGAQFGQQFQYDFLFTPYVLGDLLLTTLVQLTGVAAAGAIGVTFVFLSLPCALSCICAPGIRPPKLRCCCCSSASISVQTRSLRWDFWSSGYRLRSCWSRSHWRNGVVNAGPLSALRSTPQPSWSRI